MPGLETASSSAATAGPSTLVLWSVRPSRAFAGCSFPDSTSSGTTALDAGVKKAKAMPATV